MAVTREAGNVADSIMYEGRTSGNFDIQNKTSALGLITAGGWTVTGTATFTGELNNGTNGHIILSLSLIHI